jgi:hypothetical protein
MPEQLEDLEQLETSARALAGYGVCASCLFFDVGPSLCRVNSPAPGAAGKAVWPVVAQNDWCAAWRRMPDSPPPASSSSSSSAAS